MSVAAIALEHRLNANLLRRWIVAHHRALLPVKAKPQPAMLPVTIEATPAPSNSSPEHIGVRSTRRRSPAVSIEIEVNGARIHLRGGVDAQALRIVLDLLARR